jgi:hypothetical protein
VTALLARRPQQGPFQLSCRTLPFETIKKNRDIDDVCDRAGTAGTEPQREQNRAKSQFCASGPTVLLAAMVAAPINCDNPGTVSLAPFELDPYHCAFRTPKRAIRSSLGVPAASPARGLVPGRGGNRTHPSSATLSRVSRRARNDAKSGTSYAEGTKSRLAAFLVFLAVMGGFLGLLFASQATMGVAFLAFSILLAIIARTAQAGAQHAALVKALRR